MIDTSLLHIPRSKKIFLHMFVYALKLPGPLCSGKDWGAEAAVDCRGRSCQRQSQGRVSSGIMRSSQPCALASLSWTCSISQLALRTLGHVYGMYHASKIAFRAK